MGSLDQVAGKLNREASSQPVSLGDPQSKDLSPRYTLKSTWGEFPGSVGA